MKDNAYTKILELRREGASYLSITTYLNENRYTTRQGKRFTKNNVKTIIHRLKTGVSKEYIEDSHPFVQIRITPEEAHTIMSVFANDKSLNFCVKMLIRRAVTSIERFGDY